MGIIPKYHGDHPQPSGDHPQPSGDHPQGMVRGCREALLFVRTQGGAKFGSQDETCLHPSWSSSPPHAKRATPPCIVRVLVRSTEEPVWLSRAQRFAGGDEPVPLGGVVAACFDNILPAPLFVTSCITTSVRGCFGDLLGPVFKLGMSPDGWG